MLCLKSLIAFSSGYDSLYIAWKYLTETNNHVTLCFFDFSMVRQPNNQNSFELYNHQSHKINSKRSHKYLSENIRNCDIRIHLQKHMDLKYDHARQFVRTAVDWINNGDYDEIVHGSSGLYSPRAKVIRKEFETFATRGSIRFPIIEERKTIADLIYELPENLQPYAFSCNGSSDFNFECGKCHKCIRNNIIKKYKKLGKPPEIAYEAYSTSAFHQKQSKSMIEYKTKMGYYEGIT